MEIVAVAGCVSFLPALKTFPDHHDHYEYHDHHDHHDHCNHDDHGEHEEVGGYKGKLEIVHKEFGGCLISYNLQLACVRKLEVI